MSRSYKHFPLFRDQLWGKSMKKGKQQSNRKIRRKLKDTSIDIPNRGRYYKYLGLNKWDLYEYKHHQTLQDTIDDWERDQIENANGIRWWKSYRYNITLEEAIQDWKKSYVRK